MTSENGTIRGQVAEVASQKTQAGNVTQLQIGAKRMAKAQLPIKAEDRRTA